MRLPSNKLEQFRRLARQTAGMPEMAPVGKLCLPEVEQMVRNLKHMASNGLTEDIRLKASLAVLEFARREEQNYYTGNREALEILAELPQEERQTAITQMFANGLIGHKDLEALLKLFTADQAAQLEHLKEHNRQLEEQLIKAQNKIIDGTSVRTDNKGLGVPSVPYESGNYSYLQPPPAHKGITN